MEINKTQQIGIGIGVTIIILSFLIIGTKYFFFMIGIGFLIALTPFIFKLIEDAKIQAEKEEMFLEFARNLVESVKTGTPISKSIINARNKSYGVLSPHIKKLANQISLGISLTYALRVFSKDVDNQTVSRTIGLIGQAERAGGNIEEILESVAEAVTMTDKLKKERKSSISNLVFQGYIIFFIFIAIVLIMQFKIIPLLSGISGISDLAGGGASQTSLSLSDSQNEDDIKQTQEEISNSFLYLLLVQGLFTGLTIGMLSEESLKAGVKHSFALMLLSFFISSGANILFG